MRTYTCDWCKASAPMAPSPRAHVAPSLPEGWGREAADELCPACVSARDAAVSAAKAERSASPAEPAAEPAPES